MSASGRFGRLQTLVIMAALVGLGSSAGAGGLPPAAAQTGGGGQEIATLEAVRGHVSLIRQGRTTPATLSMPLELDDIVLTKRGRATVRFHSDGAVVRIGPDSRVQVNESATERDVTLFFGRLWAHVVRWKEQTTRFRSASTIAAIRGTELTVGLEADADETRVAVLEGTVETSNDAGTLMVSGGQSAVSKKGASPVRDIRVTPSNAVQWALYYLPVLSPKSGALGQDQPWQGSVDTSVEAWNKGNLAGALDALEGVSDEGIQAPGFFTYRASLLLAAGEVDGATADIDRALKLSANDSDALALQAIVAVARNEVDEANSAAQRAVSQAPDSATARIALSYAQQARFDLEGARASLEKAVELAPNDALGWARLAEIHSSLGRLDDSVDAAQKAVSLQPDLSRTQTVLGFAHLTRVQTTEAKESFQKAIEYDADDPLPRLGLGLAQIREGDLTGGIKELEVAVSLDPADSVVRSYLGKGYYEAKRGPLDEREYGVAEQADPMDPTPRFYQAIAEQTTNRPVEALESLQEAVRLNDNRAVYRSRLLLDQDLAARSAALARIYTDLGFQDRALVEGWTAVNTDPSNFSAHRFLADSYSVLPRHEIARVSELFQSQMLQPLNTTPIQPRLGESNLFLISAQGPASLSFYEFNPLFNRDQVNFQGSFLYAGSSCGVEDSLGFCPAEPDDTLAGEGIVSGIYKKVSFSAGYSGFDSDGFRENSSQKDQIANAFVQAELGPNTSVQGEVRYRKVESGDLGLRYFEDDFSPFQEETTDGTNVRVGLRQNFGPSVTVLASYMHADGTIEFTLPDPFAGVDFDIDRDEKSDSIEGQVLYGSSKLKFVGGAGYFDIDSNEANVFALDDPIFGFTETTTTDAQTTHTNLYGYGYITPVQNLTVTVGLSGDLFDETGEATSAFELPGLPPDEALPIEAAVLGSRDQANPKGGVSWTLDTGTTLRAAAFRTLKRTLITDQTLEPTQVAGFNQFFDDPTGTEAWVYGGAIDQKLGARAFAGVQYTRRDLTIPQTLIDFDPLTGERSVSVEDRDGTEDLARAYVFAAPHPWFSLGVEYGYEQIELDELLFLGFSKVKTQTVPLSARFFHPSGLSAYLGATYLDQTGDFLTFNEMGEQVYVAGSKDFWVVDLALRYRLPKRYGILAFGINNLTDERSTYYATDPRNLRIRPGRVVYASVVLAVP